VIKAFNTSDERKMQRNARQNVLSLTHPEMIQVTLGPV